MALNYLLNDFKHGDRQKLASAAGLSVGYLTHLAAGRRYGSEEARRSIAAALGFDSYETMLDFGRVLMSHKDEEKAAAVLPDFETENALMDARKILSGPLGPALKSVIACFKNIAVDGK